MDLLRPVEPIGPRLDDVRAGDLVETGTALVLDLTQSVGALPFDVAGLLHFLLTAALLLLAVLTWATLSPLPRRWLIVGALAWGDVWFDEMTRNPWNPEQGSSGSSAAKTR